MRIIYQTLPNELGEHAKVMSRGFNGEYQTKFYTKDGRCISIYYGTDRVDAYRTALHQIFGQHAPFELMELS